MNHDTPAASAYMENPPSSLLEEEITDADLQAMKDMIGSIKKDPSLLYQLSSLPLVGGDNRDRDAADFGAGFGKAVGAFGAARQNDGDLFHGVYDGPLIATRSRRRTSIHFEDDHTEVSSLGMMSFEETAFAKYQSGGLQSQQLPQRFYTEAMRKSAEIGDGEQEFYRNCNVMITRATHDAQIAMRMQRIRAMGAGGRERRSESAPSQMASGAMTFNDYSGSITEEVEIAQCSNEIGKSRFHMPEFLGREATRMKNVAQSQISKEILEKQSLVVREQSNDSQCHGKNNDSHESLALVPCTVEDQGYPTPHNEYPDEALITIEKFGEYSNYAIPLTTLIEPVKLPYHDHGALLQYGEVENESKSSTLRNDTLGKEKEIHSKSKQLQSLECQGLEISRSFEQKQPDVEYVGHYLSNKQAPSNTEVESELQPYNYDSSVMKNSEEVNKLNSSTSRNISRVRETDAISKSNQIQSSDYQISRSLRRIEISDRRQSDVSNENHTDDKAINKYHSAVSNYSSEVNRSKSSTPQSKSRLKEKEEYSKSKQTPSIERQAAERKSRRLSQTRHINGGYQLSKQQMEEGLYQHHSTVSMHCEKINQPKSLTPPNNSRVKQSQQIQPIDSQASRSSSRRFESSERRQSDVDHQPSKKHIDNEGNQLKISTPQRSSQMKRKEVRSNSNHDISIEHQKGISRQLETSERGRSHVARYPSSLEIRNEAIHNYHGAISKHMENGAQPKSSQSRSSSRVKEKEVLSKQKQIQSIARQEGSSARLVTSERRQPVIECNPGKQQIADEAIFSDQSLVPKHLEEGNQPVSLTCQSNVEMRGKKEQSKPNQSINRQEESSRRLEISKRSENNPSKQRIPLNIVGDAITSLCNDHSATSHCRENENKVTSLSSRHDSPEREKVQSREIHAELKQSQMVEHKELDCSERSETLNQKVLRLKDRSREEHMKSKKRVNSTDDKPPDTLELSRSRSRAVRPEENCQVSFDSSIFMGKSHRSSSQPPISSIITEQNALSTCSRQFSQSDHNLFDNVDHSPPYGDKIKKKQHQNQEKRDASKVKERKEKNVEKVCLEPGVSDLILISNEGCQPNGLKEISEEELCLSSPDNEESHKGGSVISRFSQLVKSKSYMKKGGEGSNSSKNLHSISFDNNCASSRMSTGSNSGSVSQIMSHVSHFGGGAFSSPLARRRTATEDHCNASLAPSDWEKTTIRSAEDSDRPFITNEENDNVAMRKELTVMTGELARLCDHKGRCVIHPHIRLQKKVLWGWKVLFKHCPDCAIEEMREAQKKLAAQQLHSKKKKKKNKEKKDDLSKEVMEAHKNLFDNSENGNSEENELNVAVEDKPKDEFKPMNPESNTSLVRINQREQNSHDEPGKEVNDPNMSLIVSKKANSKKVNGLPWSDYNGHSGRYTGEVNDQYLPHGIGEMVYDRGIISSGTWYEGVLDTEGPTTQNDHTPNRLSKYSIGDKGCDEDMVIQSKSDTLAAMSHVRVNDAAFVRRSDGSWTYAIVKERTDGEDASIKFIVNVRGSTKTFPCSQWGAYTRPIKQRNDAPVKRPTLDRFFQNQKSNSVQSSTVCGYNFHESSDVSVSSARSAPILMGNLTTGKINIRSRSRSRSRGKHHVTTLPLLFSSSMSVREEMEGNDNFGWETASGSGYCLRGIDP